MVSCRRQLNSLRCANHLWLRAAEKHTVDKRFCICISVVSVPTPSASEGGVRTYLLTGLAIIRLSYKVPFCEKNECRVRHQLSGYLLLTWIWVLPTFFSQGNMFILADFHLHLPKQDRQTEQLNLSTPSVDHSLSLVLLMFCVLCSVSAFGQVG